RMQTMLWPFLPYELQKDLFQRLHRTGFKDGASAGGVLGGRRIPQHEQSKSRRGVLSHPSRTSRVQRKMVFCRCRCLGQSNPFVELQVSLFFKGGGKQL